MFRKICPQLLLSSLLAISLLFSLPLKAQDNPNSPTSGGVSVIPAEQSDSANLQSKSWFIEKVEPGQNVTRKAKIINSTQSEQEIEIVAKDAIQTTDGGFSYKENGEENAQVGNWVKLEKNKVTVAANSSAEVEFTLSVPEKTEAGEYAGVVAVNLPLKEDPSTAVVVQNRVGARIYVTVPGDLKTATKVDNLSFVIPGSPFFSNLVQGKMTDKVFLSLNGQNVGNVFTKTFYKVSLEGPEGKVDKIADQDLMPKQNPAGLLLEMGPKWQVGKYKARVEIDNRPIINSNKGDNLKEESPQKVFELDIEMTEESLKKMQTEANFTSQNTPAQNQNSTGGALQIREDAQPQVNTADPAAASKEETKKTDSSIYWLVGGISALFLIILAGLGFYVWNLQKTLKQKNK